MLWFCQPRFVLGNLVTLFSLRAIQLQIKCLAYGLKTQRPHHLISFRQPGMYLRVLVLLAVAFRCASSLPPFMLYSNTGDNSSYRDVKVSEPRTAVRPVKAVSIRCLLQREDWRQPIRLIYGGFWRGDNNDC
uniref:Secreted protein n=1 Tax=Steinernema glaseri TaxID=37863 RepID=A0A1I7Z1S8_9BILA